MNAVIEKTNDNFSGVSPQLKGDHSSFYGGAKCDVGGGNFAKIAYTSSGNIAGVANTGSKQFSLGFDHDMSPRTTVYALYTKLSNDSGANKALSSVASISTGAVTGGGLDSDPSAFSLGLKHAF